MRAKSATVLLSGVLALTACGSPAPSHHHMASHHAMAESAPFGPDCGMVPASGMGSFHSMAMDPLLRAAAHNPLLAGFAAAATRAGLRGELDSMHSITVFAPETSAFTKLAGGEMAMLHQMAALSKVVKYEVVNGQVGRQKLASGMTLQTLQGSSLRPARMGSVYEVNGADVICGGIHTANATVYLTNKVLIPMHA